MPTGMPSNPCKCYILFYQCLPLHFELVAHSFRTFPPIQYFLFHFQSYYFHIFHILLTFSTPSENYGSFLVVFLSPYLKTIITPLFPKGNVHFFHHVQPVYFKPKQNFGSTLTKYSCNYLFVFLYIIFFTTFIFSIYARQIDTFLL